MILRRAVLAVALVAILLAGFAWLATAPEPLSVAQLPSHTPDVGNGERIFRAGGCASCHAAPDAQSGDKLELGGGLELVTDFGIFRVPNISPDPETGIGGWSTLDFANAVLRGVSPGGAHYYPAFPYSSYVRMRPEDVIDLKAFMDALPPVSNRVAEHDLGFPYNIRRGIGLWKRLYVSANPVVALPNAGDIMKRGQYLVEGPGHCGECHTSRDWMGGLKTGLWLAGAPNPEGRGTIPNITPHVKGLTWSESEIVSVLKSGITPDFDELSGRMRAVQHELSHLPDGDLQSIAAYLKAVPPLPDAVPAEADEE
jgi:mono/diheme cytochrome c family protein